MKKVKKLYSVILFVVFLAVVANLFVASRSIIKNHNITQAYFLENVSRNMEFVVQMQEAAINILKNSSKSTLKRLLFILNTSRRITSVVLVKSNQANEVFRKESKIFNKHYAQKNLDNAIKIILAPKKIFLQKQKRIGNGTSILIKSDITSLLNNDYFEFCSNKIHCPSAQEVALQSKTINFGKFYLKTKNDFYKIGINLTAIIYFNVVIFIFLAIMAPFAIKSVQKNMETSNATFMSTF